MARQFKGAAKARGFNPIPISSANITRMREENERVIRGLRERRESERNNEERQLQAMQADAAYYEKVRERDFKITDLNLTQEARQASFDAEAKLNRIQQQDAAVTEMFNAVASFSETAAKHAKLAEEKRDEERREEGQRIAEQNDHLTFAQLKFDKAQDEEAVARVILASTMDQLRAAGASEEQLQKAQGLGVQGSLALFRAKAKLTTQGELPKFIADYVRENSIDLSQSDSTSPWYGDVWKLFQEKHGWSQLSTEILSDALKEKTRIFGTYKEAVSATNTANVQAQTLNDLTTIVLGGDFVKEIPGVFHEVVTAYYGDKKAGHDWIVQNFESMDANGKFYLDEDNLYKMSVMPDGQPYYIPPGETVTVNGKTWKVGSHQNRGVEILNKRAEKRREWRRNEDADDRLSYNEESKQWLRHVVIDGNMQDIGAAKKSFEDNVQGEPEWLRKLTNAGANGQGQYNTDLISMAKDMEARGMLYPGLIQKVNERNPKLANELQESYEKQDPFMRDDMYKKNFESIDKLPLVMDSNGNYPAPSAAANKATATLQEAYRQLVERAVADGAEIKDAAYTSLKAIEDGFAQPDSPFVRVYNANTGQYEFPKLYTKTPQEIAEDIDEADEQFLKNLDAGHNKTKLKQAMFASPEIVLTSDQYDQQIVDMQSPGFTFHPRIDMLVQTGAVDSHMDGLALVGAAQKKPPIVPPPSLQTTANYSAKANQMLALWGPRSSNIEARAHGVGMQAQLPEARPEAALSLIPDTLRNFYMSSAQKHGVDVAENAAMGEIESAHGKYRKSYTGTSFGVMQINKSAHPEFYAQHNGNPSDEANIDYGTRYYAEKKREFNGDAIAAAMAYNAGSTHYRAWLAGEKPAWVTDPKQTPAEREDSEKEWVRIVNEMTNHGTKFAKAYYKYSGDASLLQNPLLLRK